MNEMLKSAIDMRIFELEDCLSGTLGHPAASEPIERLATRIYYSADATEMERHLADRILSLQDYARDMPALISGFEPTDDEDLEAVNRALREDIDEELKRNAKDRDALHKLAQIVRAAQYKKRKTVKVEDLAAALPIDYR